MAHNFVAKLKLTNLASKSDIVDLVKKTNFDDKLINLNKIATLNKTVHSPIQDELNEVSVKVELTSTYGFTKDLINKYSILSGEKYFSSGLLQNYSVFISTNEYTK